MATTQLSDTHKADIEHVARKEDDIGPAIQMKSSMDKIPVFKALVKYKRVAMWAMLAAFSASLDGYQINLNGSIIVNTGFIKALFGPDATSSPAKYVSAWGGIQSAGQVVGQMGMPILNDRFGRKVGLYSLWLVLVLSIAVESNVHHWYEWLVAKLFSGIGVGMLQATMPLYIAEQAPNQLRGFLINAYSFWFVVGQLLAPVALDSLNRTHPEKYDVAIWTQWGPIGLMIIIFVLLPESPWWLVSKGRDDAARKVLQKSFQGVDDYDVEEAIGIMRATIDQEIHESAKQKAIPLLDTFRGTDGRRMLIALWPKFIQTWVGLSIFNTYATYFFSLAGNANPFLVTVILACCQLVAVVVVAFTTDKFGRRPLTLYPYMITVVAVYGLGIIGCFDYASPTLGSLLVFFACVATFTTTGASAIGYAYIAEIPSQRFRARVAAWGLGLPNAIVGIPISFLTPIMLKGPNSDGGWKVQTAFFFAGTGTIAVAIGWFLLPEVARRSPAEIDEMFAKKVPSRKFKGYVTEVEKNLDAKEASDAAISAKL